MSSHFALALALAALVMLNDRTPEAESYFRLSIVSAPGLRFPERSLGPNKAAATMADDFQDKRKDL